MYLYFKRAIDILLSAAALILLLPVFLILIIAIRLDSKGPILFRQKRVGKHKTCFNMLKFRTMYIDAPKDTPTHLLENPEQWITNVGKFLRRSSLDELPQIWNIFIGKMSIIGPRPALWNQYDLIKERDKYSANDIKPGLTGWAQINGRDELPIEIKARLDGEYAEKMSFAFDVKCFIGTIVNVLRGAGVVEGGTGRLKAKSGITANQRDVSL
jgi:O-antigen biosynthesis protein WbqP